jgi:hypothetical protein
MRILKFLALAIVIVIAGGYGTYKYKNSTPPQLKEPNYFAYYKSQDTKPEGKVGIFISHLIMPEDMQVVDFHNLALKIIQYIPWPISTIFADDNGVVLLHPDKFYEFEEFTPDVLVDINGNENDVDGIPYADKYPTGDVVWVPPRETLHLDHGYFLLTTRNGGMASVAAKLINKANVYYYDKGIRGGKIPHESGNRWLAEQAMQRIKAKYGDIPYRWITAEDFGRAKREMFSLLDEGVDTVIFAAPRPIYSHHEEFNGSIKHGVHYIHEWEALNPGKKIKYIISPQIGDYEVIRETWVNMLQDRLDTLPTGSDVKVVMSVHGMAWERVPHEAWIELAPLYRDGTLEELRTLTESYDFGRTDVVLSQDHFADPYNNPNGTYLSTNAAFWDGINDGYDYVINVPIEFFFENTDTMFSHAMFNFEHFPNYDRYEQVVYDDWSVPFTRQYVVEDTTVIFNGLPAKQYSQPIIDAFVLALDSILSQGMDPVTPATAASNRANN